MNSLSVQCPHCHAAVGQPCAALGTGLALQLSQAHPSRLEIAGQEPDWTAVEKYRHLYAAEPPVEQNGQDG